MDAAWLDHLADDASSGEATAVSDLADCWAAHVCSEDGEDEEGAGADAGDGAAPGDGDGQFAVWDPGGAPAVVHGLAAVQAALAEKGDVGMTRSEVKQAKQTMSKALTLAGPGPASLRSAGQALLLIDQTLDRMAEGIGEDLVIDTGYGLQDLCQQFLDQRRAALLSDHAIALKADVPHKQVPDVRRRLAASLFAGMRFAANELLDGMCARVKAHGGQCIALYEVHRGDETPFAKVTVSSHCPALHPWLQCISPPAGYGEAEVAVRALDTQQWKNKVSAHAKVYQPEVKVAGLFQLAGRYHMVSLDLPVFLQAHTSGCAEIYAAGADILSYTLPCQQHFDRVQRLVTADGDGAIAKAERAFSRRKCVEGVSPVESLQHWCLIHRMYKTISQPMLRFKGFTTGMIRLALSVRGPGHWVRFQKLLRDEILSSLDYKQGAPGPGRSADQYRLALIHNFVDPDELTGKKQHVRAFVIKTLVNGDIRRRDCFQHVCGPGCCRNRDDCVEKVKTFLIPALAGALPPVFKRDRWTGNDEAPAWMGLLEGIHGLLSRVYRRWYSVVVRRPLPPLHPELLSGHVLSWADRLLDAPGGLSGDEGDEDADNIGDEVHEHETCCV